MLESIRNVWPGAEIILSTWKDSQTDRLNYDKLVLSDDPGATPYNDTNLKGNLHNINRQIVSTRNGLAAATRQYAVKVRTDCPLARPFDFRYLDSNTRLSEWSLLVKPVAVLNLYTRHPLRRPVLFHVSDLFHAGLLSDLLTLWSAPLVEEPMFTRTIDPQSPPLINAYRADGFLMRCAAEQYLGEALAKRKVPSLRLRHHSDGSAAQLFLWLRVLANNFLVVTPNEAGVVPPERLAKHEFDWDLFRPDDREWLARWARPGLPVSLRLHSLVQFYEAQLNATPPSRLRHFCKRVLHRIAASWRAG